MNGGPGCLLVLYSLRIPAYIVCTVVAAVMWGVAGFPHLPWITGLVGSIVVGSAIMIAKGPQRGLNLVAGACLLVVIDALLVLGIVKLGFSQAFLAWGIAHLAAVLTGSLMMMGAQGAALSAGSEAEVADWILSRGIVIGLGAAVATAVCGGI